MKNKIKLLLSSAAILLTIIVTAQQPPNFDAKKAAGLVTYESEKVIKKLKISDEDTKKSIVLALETFNMEIYELSDEHSNQLQELDEYFDRQIKVAMQRRDRSQMDGVKTQIGETIPPIRQQVATHEEVLNTAMKAELDSKQYDMDQVSKKPKTYAIPDDGRVKRKTKRGVELTQYSSLTP